MPTQDADGRALGLGTGALGGLYGFTPSAEQAAALIELAWSEGVRHFDTAPSYGFGLAEKRLGQTLPTKPADSYTLSTKVGWLLRHDHSGEQTLVPDFSPKGVLGSLESSLARLGVDAVDIALVHDPDHHFEAAVKSALPALVDLRDQGVISAVGIGMNHADLLAKFVEAVDLDCVLIAGRYTLLDQAALEELLPLCESTGTAVVVGGVYNSGILADPMRRPMFNYVPAAPEVVARAQALEEVCSRFAVPLRAAAIQFPLGHPAVHVVLTGAATVDELGDTIRMFDVPLPGELWEEFKRVGLLPEAAPVPSPS